jgi:polyphosphate glucokinase
VGFDYEGAFRRPVRIINDAAMQALGSYQQGKMLFLGLGTGLGSCSVVNGKVGPLELAHLPYKKGTYEDYVGRRRLQRRGQAKWTKDVVEVVHHLNNAFRPDEIVLGGGNAKKLMAIPRGCRLGGNAHAFLGGYRMWEEAETSPRKPKRAGTQTTRASVPQRARHTGTLSTRPKAPARAKTTSTRSSPISS